MKREIRNVKMSIDIAKTSDKEVTNIDIIRRVSNLEKIVYGKSSMLQEEDMEEDVEEDK